MSRCEAASWMSQVGFMLSLPGLPTLEGSRGG